ncbi:MAG: L,D-transpeptidase [Solirubrobacteraceae bacterium]
MRAFAITVLALLSIAAPAAAQAPAPTSTPAPVGTPRPGTEPVVASGVRIAGIAVARQTRAELIETLRGPVLDVVKRPVRISRAGKKGTLKPRAVKLRMEVGKTADRVFATPANGVALPVTDFERKPVQAFLKRFAPRVAVAAQDAAVQINVTRIGRSPGKPGRRLDFKPVVSAIKRALRDPLSPHSLRAPLATVKPDVTGADLKDAYPTIVTIDQSTFTLRLFRRLRYDRSYGVAVGQAEYPTPNGVFAIQSKQVNPTWTAPNSPWAGESAGQSFDSSDPNNPLRARWMGVNGSIGIHGTGEDYSIGSRASHGCIRMHEADVIDLFDRVEIGTPVLIAG